MTARSASRGGPAPGPGTASEQERLLAGAAAELEAGRDVVLATVIGTRGSTYRRAGARMLVRADATSVGLVSGGCLEADVVEAAQQTLTSRTSRVVTYDLTADEEAIWGWGLGCNGAVDVLLQDPEASRGALAKLQSGRSSRRPHVLATALDGPLSGRSLLLLEDGTVHGDLGDRTDPVVAAAGEHLREGRSERRVVDGVDVFLEAVRVPPSLLICGAGEDTVPVAVAGVALGWRVTVTDDRGARLDARGYPEPAQTVTAPPTELAAAVPLDDLTYVVIMSHDFLRDASYLGQVAGADVAYIGLLGPARRRERLLDHVAREGTTVGTADLRRIHAPAGLDLGAEGPDEIAWSICAEILAVSRGRAGGHLGLAADDDASPAP